MSSSEIKTSSATTPREMARAKVLEADKIILEAGSPACISEGITILKDALLSVARNNPIGDTISCITNMLRDTAIAMSIGPILEAYTAYTGPTTDIQVTIGGGESDEKSIFIALPTKENATINFQYSDTLSKVPDNFLSRENGEALNDTFIQKEDFAATLLLYVDGIRHQTTPSDDPWYIKQHGYAMELLKDLS